MILVVSASAQTLTGSVKNGTTNKPAAGDDVVLLSLGQGMEESGRTQTDAKGNFSVKLDNASSPHLVRIIHQGVTYHKMAPPGTTSVDIDVYDVSKKVQGISVTADVMRFQAQGSELQGIRLFAVNNSSDPPRTQMSDQSFEFYLPDGAQVDQSMAMTSGGQPINSASRAPETKEPIRLRISAATRRNSVPGQLSHAVQRRSQFRSEDAVWCPAFRGGAAEEYAVLARHRRSLQGNAGSAPGGRRGTSRF